MIKNRTQNKILDLITCKTGCSKSEPVCIMVQNHKPWIQMLLLGTLRETIQKSGRAAHCLVPTNGESNVFWILAVLIPSLSPWTVCFTACVFLLLTASPGFCPVSIAMGQKTTLSWVSSKPSISSSLIHVFSEQRFVLSRQQSLYLDAISHASNIPSHSR